jgi:MFS family permease
VVGAAFTIATFAWGVGFYGPPVFLQNLQVERGWSISAISAAVSAHFLFSAGLVAYLSDLHRRFGLVPVTRGGAIALALGALAWSLAREPWQLFPIALLSGTGWALLSGAAINAMVAPWFDRRRPAALAMAFNGASVGGVLFTPLWVGLIAMLGFPGAALVIGCTMVGLTWSLAGSYLRPTPASLGIRPDGEDQPAAQPEAPSRASPLPRSALFRDPRFRTLSAAFALGLFAQVGVVSHIVALLAPRFGDTGAAVTLSAVTASAVAGRTLLGWLIKGRDRRLVAAANFVLQACGVLLLAVPGGPALLVILGAILFGLGFGNLVSLPPLIAQSEFEKIDVPRVVALVVAINQAAFAFAPATFGLLRDATAGYGTSLILAVALQLGGAAVVLLVCQPWLKGDQHDWRKNTPQSG